MINALLHRQPTALDRNEHRSVSLQMPVADWSVAGDLNALFVAATEFGDTAREFPIVFVRAGDDDDGRTAIAPIAVFGLQSRQNLYVGGSGNWRAAYMPAVLRMYPFAIGRIDAERFAICLDVAWKGIAQRDAAGTEALFTAEGEQTPFMQTVQKQLEVIEGEIQRTRRMCRQLRDLDVLRDMRFDATLPDGKKIALDGFLTVDDKKLHDLPDATVGELHRSGLLGLIHAHFVSMGNMRRLLDWQAERAAGT